MTDQIILTPDQVAQLAAQVADIIASRISVQPHGEHWPEQMPPKVAAQYLGISVRTVHQRAKAGIYRKYRLEGVGPYFLKRELDILK